MNVSFPVRRLGTVTLGTEPGRVGFVYLARGYVPGAENRMVYTQLVCAVEPGRQGGTCLCWTPRLVCQAQEL